MKILMIIMFLFSISSSCFAINLDPYYWMKVYDNGNGDKCYINLETVEFPKGNQQLFGCSEAHRYVSSWVYSEVPKTRRYKYALVYMNVDLDCKKMLPESMTTYDKKGKVVSQTNRLDSTPYRVVPGTKGDIQLLAFEAIWRFREDTLGNNK